MAAAVLPRLAGLAAEPRYRNVAEAAILPWQPLLAQYPLGFGQWLIALDYLLAAPREIAIVGDAEADGTQELLRIARAGYQPHQVVALAPADAGQAAIPLLRGHQLIAGRPTAYLCRGSTCLPPVSDPRGLQALLDTVAAGT